MATRPQDWMAAASCGEGPCPAATFADLPRQHQEEVVRYALVAAASTAYFVALALLAWPLPSRSLVSDAVLPQPVAARPPALEARLVRTIAGAPASAHRHLSRPRPAVALAALREPVGGSPAINASPRRNLLGRFFRGVLRTVSRG